MKNKTIPKLLPLFSRNLKQIDQMINYFKSKFHQLNNEYLRLIYDVSKITKMKYHGYCLLNENRVIDKHVVKIDEKNINVVLIITGFIK